MGGKTSPNAHLTLHALFRMRNGRLVHDFYGTFVFGSDV